MGELEIHPEYAEGVPTLDFSEVEFLTLESLTIRHQSIKSVHFTKEKTPLLSILHLDQTRPAVDKFHLDLPELVFMNVEFLTVMNPTGFGKSISRCPKLETFFGYKLWGLHVPRRKTNRLVLPNCNKLELHRSDDLNYLDIWAPKLEDLNLRACFSLDEVNILDRKPNGYGGPQYSFNGTPSQYKVNLINTFDLDEENPLGNIGNVTTHPRCNNVITNEAEELEALERNFI